MVGTKHQDYWKEKIIFAFFFWVAPQQQNAVFSLFWREMYSDDGVNNTQQWEQT